ncbi:MAG: prepilin-type N-terminal cleavage/methylation domain-containing protein [candidate division WOR-3 bacterium]|nr:prepilin-type N-terminal cleavage/methylation domain-containing protein [candidate division WOR-3 bacterium]
MNSRYNKQLKGIYQILNSDKGVTLMELLVVILIIALLGAVAFRTIDATTNQSRFEATRKEMLELVKGIIGNPDLLSDGVRINFGYVGDMGKLPDSLSALFLPEGDNWKGPYVSGRFSEDQKGWLTDAWGQPYEYDKANLLIRSTGGRQTLTAKIIDDTNDLFNNSISGVITDITGGPPVELANKILIRLIVPRDGILVTETTRPRRDGFYEFSSVPIGYHLMVVKKEFGTQDSIIRMVSVPPRSKIVADFRFASGFRDNLKYVEGSASAWGDSLNCIGFSVFNSGEAVTLDSLVVILLDTTAFYESVNFQGSEVWNYAASVPPRRAGKNDVVALNPAPTINTNSVARFDLMNFKNHQINIYAPTVVMSGIKIAIKFSDGSIVEFTP